MSQIVGLTPSISDVGVAQYKKAFTSADANAFLKLFDMILIEYNCNFVYDRFENVFDYADDFF